jgi:hypothetical protein
VTLYRLKSQASFPKNDRNKNKKPRAWFTPGAKNAPILLLQQSVKSIGVAMASADAMAGAFIAIKCIRKCD